MLRNGECLMLDRYLGCRGVLVTSRHRKSDERCDRQ